MSPVRRFPARLAAAALLIASQVAAQTPPEYRVTFLGPAGSVSALSETGLVAGQVTVAGATRGYVAAVGMAPTLLPLAPGDKSSWALDVNEQGVVVGALSTTTSPEFSPRAAVWHPDGLGGFVLTELGHLPGHTGGVATAVNNLGDIVGWSVSGMFRYAVWFSAPGGVMDLNPFGVFDPQSINDQRVFVDKQARRMDLGTLTVEVLGTPPGPPSYSAVTGYAINELGCVAGTAVLATSTSCVYQAARYVDGPGWQILSPCSPVANAYDINDQGDVLYKAFLSLVNVLHLEGYGEFALEQVLAREAAGWDILGFHADINGARQIAAIASNAGTGETGVVLMTPTWNCQASLGYAGPGPSQLAVCGGDLSTGTTADLSVSGVPAFATVYLAAGVASTPTPFKGGTLVPVPVVILQAFAAGPAGTLLVPGIPGGHGPFSAYVQAVHADADLPAGYGLSNAVRLDLLP